MWFLILLTLLNSALDEHGFVLVHRMQIGGLPINVLDGVLGVGVLFAAIGFMRSSPSRFQTARAHPVYVTTIVLFVLAVAVGLIGAMSLGSKTYLVALFLRNMTAIPAAMFCGYYFYQRPTSAKWFSYVHVIGGVCSAGLILLFFVGKSAENSTSSRVDVIRAIQYVSVYAGLAAAFLLFTLMQRESRIMWPSFAIMIGGFCLLGQFATLSRSDWVAATATIFSIPFLLPRQGRVKRLAVFVVATVLVFAMFLGGLYVGAKVTGRDLSTAVYKRMLTALPFARGDDSYSSSKAWDTRLPGVYAEIKYWLESPIIGQGFGYTDARALETSEIGFNHNVWTAALATTGVVGFAAYFVPVVGLIVIGRRMVRDRFDEGTVLIGAIGFTAGIYHLVIGAATMSFNMQRGALLTGLICGVVFRARMMQLTQKELFAGYVDTVDHGEGYPLGPEYAAGDYRPLEA